MPSNDCPCLTASSPTREPDPISQALESLVSRHTVAIRRVARQHGLSGPDADEVVQDVRIRIWRALSNSDRIAAVSASYVYRTATSAARDILRRRRTRRAREAASERPGLSAHATLNGAVADGVEIAERISRALDVLNEARRRVVRLHLVGYHRLEIADRLGWTEARTRHLLYRGLAELRASLMEDPGERLREARN